MPREIKIPAAQETIRDAEVKQATAELVDLKKKGKQKNLTELADRVERIEKILGI